MNVTGKRKNGLEKSKLMNGDFPPAKRLKGNGLNTLDNQGSLEEVETLAKLISSRIRHAPKLGIVCGSGLGGLADVVEDKQIIKYSELEGLPVSTVPGHVGQFVFGLLDKVPVMLMQGRVHVYEGYPLHRIVLPIRVMWKLGIKNLILTNAAGGINPEYKVGDIMIMKDHLNLPGFCGINPLIGINDDRIGPRFPPMSDAYNKEYRAIAKQTAKELGFSDFIREGVYSFLTGPTFETVTECRLLRLIGTDATGMSTVPEAIVARHCGMEVLAMSLITNSCVMEFDSDQTANHEEVLETGKSRSSDMQKLITKIVEKLAV
ncbi:purine nucleoside phosphorylase-like isoform X1 [Saccostrea echinata]|uniref:purine nucleoside phosphorylase-like isoform X1 n=1 Tax=Saccostrea echinata TaxID=191078 RepID=UPI002A7F2FCB|nr:purine nucleoside phosphorylase-like isoform X1 [Saccostrea echinata]